MAHSDRVARTTSRNEDQRRPRRVTEAALHHPNSYDRSNIVGLAQNKGGPNESTRKRFRRVQKDEANLS